MIDSNWSLCYPNYCFALLCPLKRIHNMHYFSVLAFNLLGHKVCWIDGTSGCSNPQVYPVMSTQFPHLQTQCSLPTTQAYPSERCSLDTLEILRGSQNESSNHRWFIGSRWNSWIFSTVLLSRGHGLAKNWRKEVKETSLPGRNLSLKCFREAWISWWSKTWLLFRNLRSEYFFFQKQDNSASHTEDWEQSPNKNSMHCPFNNNICMGCF